MATLKQYDSKNTSSTKQFNVALNTVFGSIAQRNEQVQQLLIVAVCEAHRNGADGMSTNNLDWLTRLLNLAEETKGVNLSKMVKYVSEVLCCKTVTWNTDKKRLAKKADKKIKLSYNVEPDCSWFDYGKKATVAQAFDYGKRVTSAINSAMNEEKGGLTLNEIMLAVMASESVSIADLMAAIEGINPIQEVA